MIKNIFNAVFISLFFFSCSDNYEKEIMKNAPQTALSSYKVTPEEAQEVILRDIPEIGKFKATNSLRVSCLFCIFKHSPQKTV